MRTYHITHPDRRRAGIKVHVYREAGMYSTNGVGRYFRKCGMSGSGTPFAASPEVTEVAREEIVDDLTICGSCRAATDLPRLNELLEPAADGSPQRVRIDDDGQPVDAAALNGTDAAVEHPPPRDDPEEVPTDD